LCSIFQSRIFSRSPPYDDDDDDDDNNDDANAGDTDAMRQCGNETAP